MATQNYIFRFWQRFIQLIQTSSIWGDNRSLNRQRRFILFMVATTLVVSACGKNIAQTNNKSEASTSKVMKSVQHALGKTKVPVTPTKIVVLDLLSFNSRSRHIPGYAASWGFWNHYQQLAVFMVVQIDVDT